MTRYNIVIPVDITDNPEFTPNVVAARALREVCNAIQHDDGTCKLLLPLATVGTPVLKLDNDRHES